VALSKNGKLRIWSILIGVGSGILLSLWMGYMDFTPIVEQKWIGFPRGEWPGISFDFSGQAFSLLIIFMIATLASSIESIGDAISVQKVSHPDFKKVDYASVQGCLNSDGLSNILAGAVGTVPNTTYSGNIAAIEITGVASRRVGYYAAAILALVAFFPKIAYFVAYIPDPVLGGANILFMSMLLNVGMQLISEEASNYKTSLIVSISLAAGLLSSSGLIFPSLFSPAVNVFFTNGIAVGGITAILMNGILMVLRKKPEKINLSKQLDQIPQLQQWLERISHKKGIDKGLTLKVNLIAEELFVFMLNNSSNIDGKMSFRFRYEDEQIQLDMNDKGKVEDVDIPVEMEKVWKDTPEKLGLVLVQKLASEFEHTKISDYNYISIKVNTYQ
jgi:NCS2 family nucleobase:cation symporter-2/xanthine permease XanP